MLRWLATPLRPFVVVLVPDRMGPDIVAGRYGWPLLSVIACACVAAFALGTRLDVGPEVRAESSGTPTVSATATVDPKPTEIKTDREIDDDIAQRRSVARVKLGLGAVFVTPLRVLALGLALLLLARFIGGKPTMPRALTVAGLAALPGAVRSLVIALVAWRAPRVFPDELDSLVSFPRVIPDGHPVLSRLFAGVDVFTWWSLVVVVLGLCTAADLKPRKCLAAIAISFTLYLVVTNLIMGGAAPPTGAGR
jgi:hypothetical protein